MLVNTVKSCSEVFPLVGRRRNIRKHVMGGGHWLLWLEVVDIGGKFSVRSSLRVK
jgi:hypothetical protein